MGNWTRKLPFVVLLLGLFGQSAAADTLYFMTVFGSECHSLRLQRAHTFASFIKATGCGDDWDSYRLEVYTMSWLPRTGEVRVWCLVPEEGDNYSLQETLDWARVENAAVKKWGPFRIDEATWECALHRIGVLENDLLKYQAFDPFRRTSITNCIHAVSGVDRNDGRIRFPLIRVGCAASRHIAEVFCENGLCHREESLGYSWVDRRMGITETAIESCQPRRAPLIPLLGRGPCAARELQFADAEVDATPDFVVQPGHSYRLSF